MLPSLYVSFLQEGVAFDTSSVLSVTKTGQTTRVVSSTPCEISTPWKYHKVSFAKLVEYSLTLKRNGIDCFHLEHEDSYLLAVPEKDYEESSRIFHILNLESSVLTLPDHLKSGSWRVILLGTGPSTAIPSIKCITQQRKNCICDNSIQSPLNKRLNPSIVLSRIKPGVDGGEGEVEFNLLVDVCKTFREAALAFFLPNGIKNIDAIILTHQHADAVGGLDEIREVQARGSSTPIYADELTENSIKMTHPYLFPKSGSVSQLYVGSLVPHLFSPFQPFTILDMEITPIPLWHGPSLCMGFSFHVLDSSTQFIYFSDFKNRSTQEEKDFPPPDAYGRVIPLVLPEDYSNFTLFVDKEASLQILRKWDISLMILDCLGWEFGPISHAVYPEVVQLIHAFHKEGLIPKQIYFTGMGCVLDYTVLAKKLREEFGGEEGRAPVMPGYDGLKFWL